MIILKTNKNLQNGFLSINPIHQISKNHLIIFYKKMKIIKNYLIQRQKVY